MIFLLLKQIFFWYNILKRLRIIVLSFWKKLIQITEFSSMSSLETLILDRCVSLIMIHTSVGVVKKLTTLYLNRSYKHKGFPSSI